MAVGEAGGPGASLAPFRAPRGWGRLVLGVCDCPLPCADAAGVRLCPWWCCSFQVGCLLDEGLGFAGLGLEQGDFAAGVCSVPWAQQEGGARPRLVQPLWCLLCPCWALSPLAADAGCGAGCQGGGQSSSSAFPRVAGEVSRPPTPQEHCFSLDVAPLPPVMLLGVGLARALPVPIINPGSSAVASWCQACHRFLHWNFAPPCQSLATAGHLVPWGGRAMLQNLEAR